MTSGTVVRRATLDETEALAQVYIDSRLKSADAGQRDLSFDVVHRWLRKSVIFNEVWVLETVEHGPTGEPAEVIAGVLALTDRELDALDVDPRYRGRGYGDALLAHAKEQRPKGLRARVAHGQEATREFLVRNGFEPAPAGAAGTDLWEDLVWRADRPVAQVSVQP